MDIWKEMIRDQLKTVRKLAPLGEYVQETDKVSFEWPTENELM